MMTRFTSQIQPFLVAPRARPRAFGPLLAGAALIFFALSAGCSRPLLSPKDQRSQYDRYDRARNQYAQQFKEDEYGRKTPNLRGRLSQKE
ncbi:MAG: hypothetical protein ACKVZJ_12620 [Phycisphaerales bacterium]